MSFWGWSTGKGCVHLGEDRPGMDGRAIQNRPDVEIPSDTGQGIGFQVGRCVHGGGDPGVGVGPQGCRGDWCPSWALWAHPGWVCVHPETRGHLSLIHTSAEGQ